MDASKINVRGNNNVTIGGDVHFNAEIKPSRFDRQGQIFRNKEATEFLAAFAKKHFKCPVIKDLSDDNFEIIWDIFLLWQKEYTHPVIFQIGSFEIRKIKKS